MWRIGRTDGSGLAALDGDGADLLEPRVVALPGTDGSTGRGAGRTTDAPGGVAAACDGMTAGVPLPGPGAPDCGAGG